MLITADWPDLPPDLHDPDAAAEMEWVVAAISAIRAIRTEVNVPAGGAPAAARQGCRCRRQRAARSPPRAHPAPCAGRADRDGRDRAGGRRRGGRRGHDADPAHRRCDRPGQGEGAARQGDRPARRRSDKIRRASSPTRRFSQRPSPRWSRSSASAKPMRAATATGCKPSTSGLAAEAVASRRMLRDQASRRQCRHIQGLPLCLGAATRLQDFTPDSTWERMLAVDWLQI